MEELVSRWQKHLWLYAHRLTADPEAAWDITQQTWLAIIRGLRKLRDPEKFRQWAFRIVRHKSSDFVKARRSAQPFAGHAVVDTQGLSRQRMDIAQVLAGLGSDQRAILTLYYFDDLKIAEISAILRIPEGTVKSRLFSARSEFKRLWQKHSDEGGGK